MRSSRQTLAGILALAGLSVASIGNNVVVSPEGRTVLTGSERQAPTPGAIGRQFAQADARKRFMSGSRSGKPTRVRPRSTGSHKQNRRRALAGR